MDRPAPWTVRRLLEWTTAFFTRKDVDSPRLSAELLLAHVLGCPRLKLFIEIERALEGPELEAFRALVQRAGEQEPIAYLTGVAHFFGLEFEVSGDVLIPRPDSETIVADIIQLARLERGFESARVLDLCTGCGCIGLAIASRLAGASVLAVDVSEKAVLMARKNAMKLGLAERFTVVCGDLFGGVEGEGADSAGPFDLIVANPPYIPSPMVEELDRSVKDFEPRLALDGGPDGLAIHRRILKEAAGRLRPGGRIYLEVMYDQGDAIGELMKGTAGLGEVKILRDLQGNDRVGMGIRE